MIEFEFDHPTSELPRGAWGYRGFRVEPVEGGTWDWVWIVDGERALITEVGDIEDALSDIRALDPLYEAVWGVCCGGRRGQGRLGAVGSMHEGLSLLRRWTEEGRYPRWATSTTNPIRVRLLLRPLRPQPPVAPIRQLSPVLEVDGRTWTAAVDAAEALPWDEWESVPRAIA